MKKFAAMFVATVLLFGGLFTQVPSNANPGNGQETCAKSDGWVKYDGLSGHSFTYPGEVPEGATVENCVKYATTVAYGTGITVVSDGKHEISHASFRVTVAEQPPLVCGDEGYVPVGDECEEEEPPRDRPDLCDRPVIGGPCAPLDEPEIGTPEVEVRNPDKSKNTDALPNTGA